jgi:RNA polymerase sigma-70 factor (ECF subfamily)
MIRSRQTSDMENFLKSVERRAYRLTLFACRHEDDALDLVQEAMCRFVGKYRAKPRTEWKALFYKVLQNKIRDYYRYEAVRSRWRIWFGRDDDDPRGDPLEQYADPGTMTPEKELMRQQAFLRLEEELHKLSYRQQQVFLLRAWEGLSVRDTAVAVGCSEGSVKTHYHRALAQLKDKLGDNWHE